jgi:(p)ppGpp synthase/HD superfamily hydrolase
MLARARTFAVHAHGSQKYGPHPYHVHLDAVATLAEPFGEQAQVVAYLHDVVEDTAVTTAQVSEEFGSFVAECVGILTDEEGDTRRERKGKTYSKMAKVHGALELALVVKAADRLANINACLRDRREDKLSMYREEQDAFRQAAFRAGLCDALWAAMDDAFERH